MSESNQGEPVQKSTPASNEYANLMPNTEHTQAYAEGMHPLMAASIHEADLGNDNAAEVLRAVAEREGERAAARHMAEQERAADLILTQAQLKLDRLTAQPWVSGQTDLIQSTHAGYELAKERIIAANGLEIDELVDYREGSPTQTGTRSAGARVDYYQKYKGPNGLSLTEQNLPSGEKNLLAILSPTKESKRNKIFSDIDEAIAATTARAEDDKTTRKRIFSDDMHDGAFRWSEDYKPFREELMSRYEAKPTGSHPLTLSEYNDYYLRASAPLQRDSIRYQIGERMYFDEVTTTIGTHAIFLVREPEAGVIPDLAHLKIPASAVSRDVEMGTHMHTRLIKEVETFAWQSERADSPLTLKLMETSRHAVYDNNHEYDKNRAELFATLQPLLLGELKITTRDPLAIDKTDSGFRVASKTRYLVLDRYFLDEYYFNDGTRRLFIDGVVRTEDEFEETREIKGGVETTEVPKSIRDLPSVLYEPLASTDSVSENALPMPREFDIGEIEGMRFNPGDMITGFKELSELDSFEQKIGSLIRGSYGLGYRGGRTGPVLSEVRPKNFHGRLINPRILIMDPDEAGVAAAADKTLAMKYAGQAFRFTALVDLHSTGRGVIGTVARLVTMYGTENPNDPTAGRQMKIAVKNMGKPKAMDYLIEDLVEESGENYHNRMSYALRHTFSGGLPGQGKR